MASSTPPTLTTTKPYQNHRIPTLHHPSNHHNNHHHHHTKPPSGSHRNPSFTPLTSSKPNLAADFSGRRSTRFVSKMHFGRVKQNGSSRHSIQAEQALQELVKASGDEKLIESVLMSFEKKLCGCDDYGFLLRELGNRNEYSMAIQCFEFAVGRERRKTEQGKLASSVISALGRLGKIELAKKVFETSVNQGMLDVEVRPNEYTLAALVHASTALKDLSLGKQLHACAMKMSLESHVFVGSAVLDLYAKASTIEEAQMVFDETRDPNVVSYTSLVCGYVKKERFDDALRIFRTMPEKNVITWNAMIGGYSQKGHNEEAVNLFIQMLRENVVPTQNTFPCVFSAAGNIAALKMGKSFHASAVKNLGNIGVFVGNSLITFYSKCGCMEESLLVFSKLRDKNIVSWNALINAYAQNGRVTEAITLYHDMKEKGVEPNGVTLLGVLFACNHAGLVDDGYAYFNEARLKNPSLLEPAHYACMVDLLARSGRFVEAERFIQDLPFDPGIGFWKALLGGCQIHLNNELGEFAAKKILALDPRDVSSYVMVSNAHSAAERWDSVSTIRQEMKQKKMKTVPGCSWVEVGCEIQVFVNGDRRSGRQDEIRAVLRYLYDHLGEYASSSSLLPC